MPNTTTDATPTDRAPRSRRWLRDVAIVAAAVTAGVVLTTQFANRGSGSDGPALELPTSATSQNQPTALRDDTPVVPAGDATSPEAAAAGFLAAEAAGDFTTSYTYLAPLDRDANPTARLWVVSHSQLSPLTGFQITSTETRRNDTYVLADVTLRSSLDPVLGLIPARATADLLVTEQADGTWRVNYSESTLIPVYPDPAGAVTAARTWAEQVQACGTPTTLVNPLYGRVSLADELCGADGELRLGDPVRLATNADGNDLIASFGPEAVDWARVVPINAPVEFGVILAPIDDVWQVVGLTRLR